MGKKLYVGNLPFTTTEDLLKDAFTQCGTVESVRIITERETGRSKGFAFVEMGSDEEAQTAITKYNGQSFEGRPLVVNEARPMPEGGSRGGRGGFGGGRGGRDGGRGGRGRF